MSWNIGFRGRRIAARQGEFLRSLRPDLVILQEVNIGAFAKIQSNANLLWEASSLVGPLISIPRGRRLACVVAGTTGALREVWPPFATMPLPERVLVADATLGAASLTVASYHAPPGVAWFEKKPQQAVAFARWLTEIDQPIILGVDANTPEIDHPTFALTRTHWHTGRRKLQGKPGDDLLFGPDKIHNLTDALRLWLADRPEELARISEQFPSGPLAVSHRTGKRKTFDGNPRRFDSIWVSSHFRVTDVQYIYEAVVPALSDHAVVMADLSLTQ